MISQTKLITQPVISKPKAFTPVTDVKTVVSAEITQPLRTQITYRRVEKNDYESILALQQENYRSNLTEDDKKNGFLSAKFTKEQFIAMNEDLGVIVAIKDKKLIGYVCGASFDYCKQFPLLKETIDDIHTHNRKINGMIMTSENTFFYGPVCIAKEERGHGILEGLFDELKRISTNHIKCYSNCAFFMSPDNIRSSTAHQKRLGVQNIGSFLSSTMNNKEFYLFARKLELPIPIVAPFINVSSTIG